MTRTTQFQVRVSPEELAEIRAAAAEQGMRLSDYVRTVAMQRATAPTRAVITGEGAGSIDAPKEPGPVARVFPAMGDRNG